MPAVKSTILSFIRGTLLFMPFILRYRLWKRFPRASRLAVQLPLFTVSIVLAISLDQTPLTQRWRIILLSEREEMEWSERRFEELVEEEGRLVLPPKDKRVQIVKRVADRLVSAMEEDSVVSSAAAFRGHHDRISGCSRAFQDKQAVKPSATTTSTFLPYVPPSSNPEKVLLHRAWDIFVVDLPRVNAGVLPTKQMFVYTGLIDLLGQDEDLLGAVLAHECSHVMLRHGAENMGAAAVCALIFDVLRGLSYAFTISFPLVSDGAASILNALQDKVASRAYSRKLESEADAVSLQLMARAGIDPKNAVALWKFLIALKESEQKSVEEHMPFLRTHPQGPSRLENIEKHLPLAEKIYRQVRLRQPPSPSVPTTRTTTSQATTAH